MPLPAGTGLTRRDFVSRTRGARARDLRRRSALGPGVRGGDRERGVDPGAERSRRRLPLGRDRRPVGALPGGRPAVLPAASEHRDRPERRVGLQPGQPAALAPDGERPRDAARRGQGLRDPGDRLRQQRRVALHLAALLGGRGAGRDAPDRLARPVPRLGRNARQPDPGPLARHRAPAGAGDEEDAGGDAPGRRPVHLRPAGPSGAPARAVDAPGGGEHRRRPRDLARSRTRRPPARSRSSPTTSTRSSASFKYGFDEPGELPGDDRSVPPPARRARGDGRGRAAAPRRHDHLARPLRHPRLAGGGACRAACS